MRRMSPVSRGRKSKKSKKKRGRGQASPPADLGLGVADATRLFGQPPQPAWFGPAIKNVLDGASVLERAGGPRELEQLTAELLGAEMHTAVQRSPEGLWFDSWFEEVIAAAAGRVVEEAGTGTSAFLLLHGLAAIGTPALASAASATCRRVRKAVGNASLPEWLDDLSRVAATGEVFRMRDAYGTRFAVFAGFSYGQERSVFLFDIDASGFTRLAGAGGFDDVDQAAAAWLAIVGDAAGAATPQEVVDPRELLCLVHCETEEDAAVIGDEPRVVMDNWFRARRRHRDLGEVLRERGMPLPAHESLYHDLDLVPVIDEFSSWYADKHGTQPDTEALAELAAEWLEGCLPGTWYAVSPERVRHNRNLIDDGWVEDDPITIGAKSLLPSWVAWLGERSGLPEHLRERVDAAAR